MKVAYSPVMTSDLKVLVNLDNCPLMCPIRVIRQLIYVQTSLHNGHVLRVTWGGYCQPQFGSCFYRVFTYSISSQSLAASLRFELKLSSKWYLEKLNMSHACSLKFSAETVRRITHESL